MKASDVAGAAGQLERSAEVIKTRERVLATGARSGKKAGAGKG